MAKVVVIGAGLSGLATAIWLADFGHDVRVCEQLDDVGGRLRSIEIAGRAVHAAPFPITMPAVLRDLFAKTGRPMHKVIDLAPAEPAFHYRFPDGAALDLPNTSRAGISRALDSTFGIGSGRAWDDVIAHGAQVWAALRPALLIATPTKRQRVEVRLSRQLRRAFGLDDTLRLLGRRLLPDPLRLMLEHRAAGADPRTAPAGMSAIPYVHQTFGRWLIAGGPGALIEALRLRAVERGATITTGAAVTAIRVENKRATGVQVAGGHAIDADIVISAVDATHLGVDLVPPRTLRRPAATPSPGRFTLTAGVDAPVNLPPHTVLLSARPDDELDALYRTSVVPDHPTIDLYPAPDGSAVTVTTLVPPHGDTPGTLDWTQPGIAAAFSDRLLQTITVRGIDLRDHIQWRDVRTPADVTRDTNACGGGAFGPSGTSVQAVFARDNRTNLRNLFLVGSSAYPGPGVPLVGLSAAMVADLIGRA